MIFNEIKNNLSVIDYAKSVGLPVEKAGDRTKSFIDPGKNNSCVIYFSNWWYDHKTQQGGDVIDLCSKFEFNGDKSKALQSLKNRLNIEDTFNSEKFRNYKADLNNNFNQWHSQLINNPEALNYFYSRNITDQTIKDLQLGLQKNGNIVIPYFKDNKPVYFIRRKLKEKQFKKASKKYYPEHIIWGLNTLDRKAPLVITEGVFDALSLYQEGFKVLSSMGGHFSKAQIKEVIQICKTFENVYLAFDNDKPGQEFTWHLAQKLIKNNISFNVINIPEKYNSTPIKDINDYYKVSHELNSLLENNSIDDLTYIANYFKGKKEEFTDFCYKLARIKPEEDINYLLDVVEREGIFDSDWIKEFRRKVTKYPPQNIVAKEILKEYELVYNEKFVFYRFNGSIWEQKTETDIKHLIDKKLGNFSTNNLITGVLGLVKSKCNKNVEFNKKNVLTFKNGVLDLDSDKLRDFNKLDYSTIQLDYEYNPEAQCPKFKKFIKDITDSDIDKAKLIQEVLGYILFPNNSLHEAFFFIGNGGNGKSVLLKIIEALFNIENISHVQIDGFTNDFQRIRLKDSLVNIQYDYKKPNKKAQYFNPDQYFKAIVAGDPINGCFKNRDFIDFTSRAKIFISANEMLNISDSSDGMKRRLIFINFPIKFVNDPVKSYEKKNDPELFNKLLEELPGIFNWVYNGYKRLKKNEKFTETSEQKILMEEFLSDNDPIIDFINSYDFDKELQFTNEGMYLIFKEWAGKNQIKVEYTQRQFSRRFKSPFLERYPNWNNNYKNNGKKGFKRD